MFSKHEREFSIFLDSVFLVETVVFIVITDFEIVRTITANSAWRLSMPFGVLVPTFAVTAMKWSTRPREISVVFSCLQFAVFVWFVFLLTRLGNARHHLPRTYITAVAIPLAVPALSIVLLSLYLWKRDSRPQRVVGALIPVADEDEAPAVNQVRQYDRLPPTGPTPQAMHRMRPERAPTWRREMGQHRSQYASIRFAPEVESGEYGCAPELTDPPNVPEEIAIETTTTSSDDDAANSLSGLHTPKFSDTESEAKVVLKKNKRFWRRRRRRKKKK